MSEWQVKYVPIRRPAPKKDDSDDGMAAIGWRIFISMIATLAVTGLITVVKSEMDSEDE